MDEIRPTATDPVADQRLLALQRRAKRGLVASYIHGISERHGRDGEVAAEHVAPELDGAPLHD